MWSVRIEDLGDTDRVEILRGGSSASFRVVFSCLEADEEFRSWYTSLLADSRFEAFFWEHPPLSRPRYDDAAEFVLVDAASLAQLKPDPTPFLPELERHRDRDVATFPNLGRDAVLLVPQPTGPRAAYAHLAAFVRGAPEPQVHGLWRETGRVVRENLGEKPRWLSTAGMGVPWVHVRLDLRPKYYRFDPYRAVG